MPLFTALLDYRSISCHYCCMALTPIYKHGTGRVGRWVVMSQLQQQRALGVLDATNYQGWTDSDLLPDTGFG